MRLAVHHRAYAMMKPLCCGLGADGHVQTLYALVIEYQFFTYTYSMTSHLDYRKAETLQGREI
jgi:hypothetical protein